jgi:hypothetical protein
MDPFTMASLLLGDTKLTPGQLAQLRAINTKYFTELYALQQKAAAGPLADRAPAVPEAELAALDATIARDIRDIVTEEQRVVLDRNWARRREQIIEQAVGDERARPASRAGTPPSPAAPAHGPAPEAGDAPSTKS